MFDGSIVAALCKQRGWNTRMLADAAGLSRESVYFLTTLRRRNPHANTIYPIAQALGVSLDTFFRD